LLLGLLPVEPPADPQPAAEQRRLDGAVAALVDRELARVDVGGAQRPAVGRDAPAGPHAFGVVDQVAADHAQLPVRRAQGARGLDPAAAGMIAGMVEVAGADQVDDASQAAVALADYVGDDAAALHVD